MSYSKIKMKAPVLSGSVLEAVVSLAEAFPSGSLFRRKMLADMGVGDFRRANPVESPVFYPLLPHDPESAEAGLPFGNETGMNYIDSSSSYEHEGDDSKKTGKGIIGGGCGFRHTGIADYVRAYRRGDITPLDAAERLVEAVAMSERNTPSLRLYISFRENDILEQARQSTERYKRGEPAGYLDGVPLAVKDEIDQAGHPTTVGTSFAGGRIAERDASVVAALRKSGALLTGKTNMHEIGLGVTGLNIHHGTSRNPYDPDCFTGGSSSGSAAVVASGICPAAVGADGGGSIRIPASLCGVVGLKPTFGRISEDGAAPLCWSLAHLGPIACTALDAALLYNIMAGKDPADPMTQMQTEALMPDFDKKDLSGLVFGIYRPWFEDADYDVRACMEKMISDFTSLGAEIREIEILDLHHFRIAHMVTIISEMRASQMKWTNESSRSYGPDVRLNMAIGAGLKSSDYVHAQRFRAKAINTMLSVLKSVDGIITPATGCTAQKISAQALVSGESNLELLDRIIRFAPPANLTGLPAISFPAGYDGRGMPVGCQIIGRAWSEHLLLRIAAVAEQIVTRRRPAWHNHIAAIA